MINHDLARQKNLSPARIAAIEALQDYRDRLGKEYKDGVISSHKYRELWTDNEYALQKLWGFPLDANYHMFWEMTGCTCPRMDNRDSWGTVVHYYNASCPIHGKTYA